MDYLTPLRRGLRLIAEYITEMTPVATLSWEEYQAEAWRRRLAERYLEMLLEAASDVARLYLFNIGVSPGSSKAESMRALAQRGVISRQVAEQLADLAHERNIFAHSYFGLKDRDIYDLLQQAKALFADFAVAVERALPPALPGDTP